MGHLGANRVLELTRARFCWPHVQTDVESYILHKCRCFKQKVPTFQTRAPLQPITTTAPFQMVSLNFVHLEKSRGGYEYILVIMDHFTRYAHVKATRNNSAKTVTEKLYNDFFPGKTPHGKEENLKIISSNNWKSCVGLDTQGLPHTIHKAMDKWHVSIVPSWPCYEPYRKRKSHIGKITSKKWYTPTIARVMSQQDSRHFISYLSDTLNPEGELNESANYREYVNNWNEAMSDTYKIANEKSSQSRAKGKKL